MATINCRGPNISNVLRIGDRTVNLVSVPQVQQSSTMVASATMTGTPDLLCTFLNFIFYVYDGVVTKCAMPLATIFPSEVDLTMTIDSVTSQYCNITITDPDDCIRSCHNDYDKCFLLCYLLAPGAGTDRKEDCTIIETPVGLFKVDDNTLRADQLGSNGGKGTAVRYDVVVKVCCPGGCMITCSNGINDDCYLPYEFVDSAGIESRGEYILDASRVSNDTIQPFAS